jgi:hypothetical protein
MKLATWLRHSAFGLALTCLFGATSALAAGCPDKPWTTNKDLKARKDLPNYYHQETLVAKTPQTAQAECSKKCFALGEPAPCWWYTVIQWQAGNAMQYECDMMNARSLKGIYNPKFPNDVNLGTPAAPLNYRGSWTYTCGR